MVDIIGQKRQATSAGFRRDDGYSLQTGKAVRYVLAGYQFRIEATRQGILVQGSFPMVGREGIFALTTMLRRAVRHHEHLASFPVGSAQEALPESILDAEDVAQAIMESERESRTTTKTIA